MLSNFNLGKEIDFNSLLNGADGQHAFFNQGGHVTLEIGGRVFAVVSAKHIRSDQGFRKITELSKGDEEINWENLKGRLRLKVNEVASSPKSYLVLETDEGMQLAVLKQDSLKDAVGSGLLKKAADALGTGNAAANGNGATNDDGQSAHSLPADQRRRVIDPLDPLRRRDIHSDSFSDLLENARNGVDRIRTATAAAGATSNTQPSAPPPDSPLLVPEKITLTASRPPIEEQIAEPKPTQDLNAASTDAPPNAGFVEKLRAGVMPQSEIFGFGAPARFAKAGRTVMVIQNVGFTMIKEAFASMPDSIRNQFSIQTPQGNWRHRAHLEPVIKDLTSGIAIKCGDSHFIISSQQNPETLDYLNARLRNEFPKAEAYIANPPERPKKEATKLKRGEPQPHIIPKSALGKIGKITNLFQAGYSVLETVNLRNREEKPCYVLSPEAWSSCPRDNLPEPSIYSGTDWIHEGHSKAASAVTCRAYVVQTWRKTNFVVLSENPSALIEAYLKERIAIDIDAIKNPKPVTQVVKQEALEQTAPEPDDKRTSPPVAIEQAEEYTGDPRSKHAWVYGHVTPSALAATHMPEGRAAPRNLFAIGHPVLEVRDKKGKGKVIGHIMSMDAWTKCPRQGLTEQTIGIQSWVVEKLYNRSLDTIKPNDALIIGSTKNVFVVLAANPPMDVAAFIKEKRGSFVYRTSKDAPEIVASSLDHVELPLLEMIAEPIIPESVKEEATADASIDEKSILQSAFSQAKASGKIIALAYRGHRRGIVADPKYIDEIEGLHMLMREQHEENVPFALTVECQESDLKSQEFLQSSFNFACDADRVIMLQSKGKQTPSLILIANDAFMQGMEGLYGHLVPNRRVVVDVAPRVDVI